MGTQVVLAPYAQFCDRAGAPLTGGKIYIGTSGANPITNPITAYLDSALTIPAAQPIRTSGGYPLNGASPTRLFVNAESYSILVRDANDAVMYSALVVDRPLIPSTLIEYATTAAETAASVVPTAKQYQPQFDEVRRLSAAIDDSTDDGPVLQKLEDLGGRSDLYPGRYVIKPTNTSPYDFGNTTNPVYRAVDLDQSGYTVVGFGATLHIKSHTSGLGGSDLQYVYASDKNFTISQNRIRFVGLTFDVENAADAVNSNHRFNYMTGVRGLRYQLTEGYSSGARRGTFGNIQNCKNVQIIGHSHYKNTQGFNFRYCQNMCIVGGIWDDFSECFDFDGTQDRAVVVGNCFESTARTGNQTMDVNGQVDAVFSGMTVYNVAQVMNASHKATTFDNYADYVADIGTPVVKTPSQRIYLGGVSGRSVGATTSTSVVLSNDWSDGGHAGYLPTHDVILTGIQLEDVSYWMAWECSRLTIRDCYLGAVITAAGTYAVNLLSLVATGDQRSWSTFTGLIDGLTINGAERGGLRLQNPEWANVRNVSVHGINTLGGTDNAVQFTGLAERGAKITVDGLNVTSGNVNINGNAAVIPAWGATTLYRRSQVVLNGSRYYRATSDTGTSAGAGGPTGITAGIVDGTVTWEYLSDPYSVYWGPNNRLAAGCTVTFSNDAYKYTHGRMYGQQIGDLAATGTVTRAIYTANRKCYVARALIVPSATVAADAVNFRTFAFKSLTNLGATTTTISSVNTQAGVTAYVQMDGGFAANEVGAYLEPGDTVYVDITSAVAGMALTGVLIQLDVLEC